MTALYTVLALFMFGVMITVHEAGHFFAARLSKIPVKEFAIGFGPPLLKWGSKKYETVFYLRAIPVGGYCMFYGEDDVQGKEADDPRAFGRHSVWGRLCTILMGPVMNLALAAVVAFGFYALYGVPRQTGAYVTEIRSVNQNSPAELAGLKAGDKIQSVNGIEIQDNLSSVLNEQSKMGTAPVEMVVLRGYGAAAGPVTLSASPLWSEEAKQSLLGIIVNIAAPVDWQRGSLGEVIHASWTMCVRAGRSILDAFGGLLFKGEGFESMSGVVGVTQMIVEETQRSRLQGYLSMMVFISINLGLVNLIPFPGLDGSRLLFLVVEAVRGKPAKKEAYVHAFGMMILFAFILFITLRDILRLL